MVRLNETDDLIDGHHYPATTEELIAACGEQRLELQNGEETVAEVLGRMGTVTYESPEDVYDALRCGVGHKAIGRRFYSDRDAPSLGERDPDPVSF